MKWKRPEALRDYEISECGRYMVNWNERQAIAIRLGTPDRGAWKGSVILGVVGTADEAKGLCDDDLLQRD